MKVRETITWLQYALANAAIVVLVLLLALQGMPPVDWTWMWLYPPPAGEAEKLAEEEENPAPVTVYLQSWAAPVARITGAETHFWKMFAPEPDNTNHRIRAEIEYYDGQTIVWRSPDWPDLSCWQRFWDSRELEYVDRVGAVRDLSPEKLQLWAAFADWLIRHHRQGDPQAHPKRVRFVVEQAIIPNPNEEGWVPMSQPVPRDEQWVVLPILTYPRPRDLSRQPPGAAGPPKSTAAP